MASQFTVGYLGMGIMGSAMARNLLKSGQFKDVYVWNRSPGKCDELVAEGAKTMATASEVVAVCDITFACLSDPEAALASVQAPGGVLEGISPGKVKLQGQSRKLSIAGYWPGLYSFRAVVYFPKPQEKRNCQ